MATAGCAWPGIVGKSEPEIGAVFQAATEEDGIGVGSSEILSFEMLGREPEEELDNEDDGAVDEEESGGGVESRLGAGEEDVVVVRVVVMMRAGWPERGAAPRSVILL